MSDFIAAEDVSTLSRHGLDSFEALWELQLVAVDAPNEGRGGWSSVFRLQLDETAYYLKRQSNYFIRSLTRPLGEPTLTREFRNIRHYQSKGIPALQAAFHGERVVAGERRAILLTHALDGWTDLEALLARWQQLAVAERRDILNACGHLAAQMHGAGLKHGCFYPKHIFLRTAEDGYEACLIDLEKTRPMLFDRAGRLRDMEALMRRAAPWSDEERRMLLARYLGLQGDDSQLDAWLDRLRARRQKKEARI
ncbi:lipopolysaccharide kinase InaA family protein [Stutzerimonas stutzeri]|uniref:lipopolysaccharide kinase InaA family protein n=1 Tax=Stutzerimonas stutzeri TaxID=316 RepID=UPI0015E2A40D|nr:lipopolysaccharide kinase InaA family protein [Stutzerimonas stutzeri]MBA1262960.1 lipopolysaccharide kinase [Stutzerimonas stutzeri]